MSNVVGPILEWLNANPEWAGLATFIISASESVAIIGTIVPGSVTMTAIGALAGAGVIPLWETLFFATIGAIAGDGISYWLGYYFKNSLRRIWPFSTNPAILEHGEHFVHKYGVMSVFIGRFVGPVRALVPLVAGMLGMRPLQFTIANVTSAIGWAPAYLLPGMLLGAVSMELPPDIALQVILTLVMITLFSVLCIWLFYRLLQLLHTQVDRLQRRLWNALKNNRITRPAAAWLVNHNPERYNKSQFNATLLLIISSVLLSCLLSTVYSVGSLAIAINQICYNFFRSIRIPQLDSLFLFFTLLGDSKLLLAAATLILLACLWQRYFRLAIHWTVLWILAGISINGIKVLIHSPRPWGILEPPSTFSMPSGHAALSFVFFMGITFFATRKMQLIYRKALFCLSSLAVLAISVSRLYLGAHWFTDIIAGWLLGILILSAVIISYQRSHAKPLRALWLLIVSTVSLLIMCTVFYIKDFDVLQKRYAQLERPTLIVSSKDWWNARVPLPNNRVSLFGIPSQYINVEWAGDLNAIRETLETSGWMKPPSRDLVSTLHRIADIGSTQYLPMVSPQYLDERPALILAKEIDRHKTLIVLRLWHSHRIFASDQPLWVGVIDSIPRSYSWPFRNKYGVISITPNLLFDPLKKHDAWEWHYKTTVQPDHKVLLIKPH